MPNQDSKAARTNIDLLSTIKNRWSPRTFSEKEISQQEMEMIFEAGRWAASSNNLQPWRFMYARKGSPTFKKMYDCLAEFNQKWAQNATILIFTAFKKDTPDGRESFHSHYDLGQAVANMSLQAHHHNIAFHQMAGLDWRKAHQVFSIPENFHISTAIAVGYYGGELSKLNTDFQEMEKATRNRNEQETFVGFEEWKL